jgi:GNAT superfamily N-acetyltransferase
MISFPTLRPATTADLEFIYRVKRDALAIFPPVAAAWNEAEQRAKVAEKLDPRYHRIILVDGEPIGIVGLVDEGDHDRVSQFFILPAHHRKGLGSAILSTFTEQADQWNRTVHVRVGQHQDTAIAFYRKHGFVDSGAPLDASGCFRLIRYPVRA